MLFSRAVQRIIRLFFIALPHQTEGTAFVRKSETAMKALQPIIAALALLLAVPVCIAGNPFVPSEKGTALTYVNRDKKGNIVSRSVQTVTDVAETAEGTVITINDKTLDADGKPLISDTLAMSDITVRIRISGDRVIFPMQNLDQLIAEIKESILGNNDIDFTVAMDEICYPLHPQVGQQLETVHISISLTANDQQFDIIKITIKDRSITGRETVTVPAGTFDCWTVNETEVMKTPIGMGTTTQSVTWYAEGIGEVKSQTLNKRGKLEESSELVSVAVARR